MMKNRVLPTILFALCTTMNMQAQSLKDLFLQMPTDVCPLLTEYNKLELIDNQKNGKVLQTRNALQTVSEMKTLTDSYAHLKVTKNSEKVFKVLDKDDGTKVIAVVSTVYVDNHPDSSVDFYDTSWNALDAKEMFDDAVSEKFKLVELNADDNRMKIVYGNPLIIDVEGKLETPKIKTETVMRKWNGMKFEKE